MSFTTQMWGNNVPTFSRFWSYWQHCWWPTFRSWAGDLHRKWQCPVRGLVKPWKLIMSYRATLVLKQELNKYPFILYYLLLKSARKRIYILIIRIRNTEKKQEEKNLLIEYISLFALELLVLFVGEISKHVVADDEDSALPEPGLQPVCPTPVILLTRHTVHVQL